MKFILAPDSFKGALRSIEVCNALRRGIESALPHAEIISIPLADGGEGSVEAICCAVKGQIHQVASYDPLGRPVEAIYGVSPKRDYAFMELASASGIELLDNSELNPLKTSTYGSGLVLKHLIEEGFRTVIIGLGGSATNDCGAGLLQALGYKYFDRNNSLLPDGIAGGDLNKIQHIDNSESIIGNITDLRLIIAGDVTNPLLGENGATAVFAPQKGATPEMLKILEDNLRHFAEIAARDLELDDFTTTFPGDGAAGGSGFALRGILGAERNSGGELILKLADFDRKCQGAQCVITGEGASDSQTAHGKLCAVVAAAARKRQVPAILLSGKINDESGALAQTFTGGVFSIAAGPGDLAAAIAATAGNLERMGRNIGLLAKGFSR
ncbi:MAG: glycerate kinase [Lentisphaeria bacterium]|nr:glycerate kinase [Lentisphaeria bacterium]